MKLSDFKKHLEGLSALNFKIAHGGLVPKHFHITEVGQINKRFIDCGGTVRNENKVNFQLWEANDFDHRLAPQKLMDIIHLSEKILNIENHEVEVEYQSDTIGKYDVDFDGTNFILISKSTNCLAKDNCGIPEEKTKLNLSELATANSCCDPKSGCCN